MTLLEGTSSVLTCRRQAISHPKSPPEPTIKLFFRQVILHLREDMSEHSKESLDSGDDRLPEGYDKDYTEPHRRIHIPARSRSSGIMADLCTVIIGVLLLLIGILLIMTLSKKETQCFHSDPHPHVHHHPAPLPIDSSPYPSSQIADSTIIWKDCGSSADEARAKGCVYDVILVAWLHPECFDSELMETYLSDNDYPFWLVRGAEMEQNITIEEVRLGNHKTVFSSAEFHLAHCSYFLEQSVRGYRARGWIDNVTADNEHTEHCARSLRDMWLPEQGYSPLHMDYHACGQLKF